MNDKPKTLDELRAELGKEGFREWMKEMVSATNKRQREIIEYLRENDLLPTEGQTLADVANYLQTDAIIGKMNAAARVEVMREKRIARAVNEDNERRELSKPEATDSAWLTLKAVAEGLGMYAGKPNKIRHDSGGVSRLVDRGELIDNGKTGKSRRISRTSLMDYCRREKLDWNESGDTGDS
jgi:hypothetical protein